MKTMLRTAAMLLVFLGQGTVAGAAESGTAQGNPGPGSQEPIDITSDQLEAFNKQRKIIFIGNVKARQRDTLIFADRLTTFYDDGGNEVQRLLAEGNVRITQEDKVATSDTALFENRQRMIVLTGNPHLWQGNDELQGDKITVYLDEDRVLVERARGVFTPGTIRQGTP